MRRPDWGPDRESDTRKEKCAHSARKEGEKRQKDELRGPTADETAQRIAVLEREK